MKSLDVVSLLIRIYKILIPNDRNLHFSNGFMQ